MRLFVDTVNAGRGLEPDHLRAEIESVAKVTIRLEHNKSTRMAEKRPGNPPIDPCVVVGADLCD
jgi:hypothetical protein